MWQSLHIVIKEKMKMKPIEWISSWNCSLPEILQVHLLSEQIIQEPEDEHDHLIFEINAQTITARNC